MAKKKPDADSSAPPEAENISSLELTLDTVPPETPAPVVTAEPVAEPVAESPEPGVDEPSLRPSVASTMRQWGYEVDDDATDDDLRSHLEQLESKAEKAAELEAELAQLREYRAQAESQRAAAPTADTKAAPTAEAVADDDLGIPDRPALDRFTLGVLQLAKQNNLLKEGAGGLLASEDRSLQTHIDKYNEHLVAVSEYDSEWGDPRKVAAHVYEKRAAKDREERESLRNEIESIKADQRQSGEQAEINQFFDKNKAAYFDLDADGNVKQDANGQPAGARYAELCKAWNRAGELGITDRKKMLEYAVERVPPVAPIAPVATESPREKVIKFRSRLKNNGTEALAAAPPANRPAAAVATRNYDKRSFNQAADSIFEDLMNAKVADRI